MNNNNFLEIKNYEMQHTKEEIELFDLLNFVKSFVYSNWNDLNYKYKTTDIIIEDDEEEEYINDEEILYKDILYI